MSSIPFNQGSQAFMDDVSTSSCTFPQGSTMQREWIDGWSHRQMRERAHRSRAIAELKLHDLLGDPSPGAFAQLFRPMSSTS